MQTWLGIDGNNWVHALWHAMQGRNVVENLVRRVKALADHCDAAHVLVCFDRRSFRHGLSAEYKAKRATKDAALVGLLAQAETAVGEVAQLVYADGYEADDLLASLAAAAVAGGARATLATADKDCWQCLVEGRVNVIREFRSAAPPTCAVMNARELEIGEKTAGLRPAMWRDYQALVGEPGDGVRGCPGWGADTSRKALVQFGSIEGMLAKPWDISCTKSQLAKLQGWAKQDMALARQLVTLRTDVAAVRDAVR
jgi:DNA polymerase-1